MYSTACCEFQRMPDSFRSSHITQRGRSGPLSSKNKKILQARKQPVWKKLLSEIREKGVLLLQVGGEGDAQEAGTVPSKAGCGPVVGTPHHRGKSSVGAGRAPRPLAVRAWLLLC